MDKENHMPKSTMTMGYRHGGTYEKDKQGNVKKVGEPAGGLTVYTREQLMAMTMDEVRAVVPQEAWAAGVKDTSKRELVNEFLDWQGKR